MGPHLCSHSHSHRAMIIAVRVSIFSSEGPRTRSSRKTRKERRRATCTQHLKKSKFFRGNPVFYSLASSSLLSASLLSVFLPGFFSISRPKAPNDKGRHRFQVPKGNPDSHKDKRSSLKVQRFSISNSETISFHPLSQTPHFSYRTRR